MDKDVKKKLKVIQREITALKATLVAKEITYTILKILFELDSSLGEMINEVFDNDK